MDISKIGTHAIPAAEATQTTGKGSGGFSEMIQKAVDRVNQADLAADKSVTDLLEGKTTITEAMVAMQKADVSLRLTMAVRNKVLEAYREIIHMQF